MPPVNIYLPCESVSVCGTAWRQETSLRLYLLHDKTTCNIWASGAPLQTQPYLTPNIPRGQSRARVAQTRPDKTSHRLTVSHPTRGLSGRGSQAGNSPSKRMCVCLQGVFYEPCLDSWEQQCDITVTEIVCSEFSSVLLIGLEVNGVALNTNGHDPSSSTDLNITVETRTKQPSIMLLFEGIYFTSILR